MHPPLGVRRGVSVSAVALLAATASGCSGGPTEPEPASSARTAAAAVASLPAVDDARTTLAATAALAQDRRYAAVYTLTVPDRPPRQVVATTAADGSWRVDVPDGALGGTADVSIVQIEAGVFQCSLPAQTRPAVCIKVADRNERVPSRYDPKVPRIFHNWLSVFTDRRSALSVSAARPLDGVPGSCYSVDSISASLQAPLDVGIYCFAADGLLTGARVDFGELRLAGAATAPPPSVDLPGPVVTGRPMSIAAIIPASGRRISSGLNDHLK